MQKLSQFCQASECYKLNQLNKHLIGLILKLVNKETILTNVASKNIDLFWNKSGSYLQQGQNFRKIISENNVRISHGHFSYDVKNTYFAMENVSYAPPPPKKKKKHMIVEFLKFSCL